MTRDLDIETPNLDNFKPNDPNQNQPQMSTNIIDATNEDLDTNQTLEALERLTLNKEIQTNQPEQIEGEIDQNEALTTSFDSTSNEIESTTEEIASISQNSDHDAHGGDGHDENQPDQHDGLHTFAQNNGLGVTGELEKSAFDLEIESQANKVQEANKVRDTVFEKSQILIKDGGGTMKFDLGTKELGQLDLAIDVQNDTLKVKITAESDKAREMLSQELPALRQALADQSLDLKTIEIGVKHEEQWSEQSSQQGQGRQEERQNEQELDSFKSSDHNTKHHLEAG